MAASQGAVSFDAIIQADRKKRKNEELASKILGKNRKAVAAGAGAGIKAQKAKPGSLASRIGVVKPSASATSKTTQNHRTQPAPVRASNSRPKRASKRRPDEERLLSALNPASGQSTVRDNPVGITIRGAGSGSFVVIGSNFAPGTTAADIQSAIEPLSGQILSCWITSQHPTVTAEITFADKWAAEKAIANFHNQKADGRILSMRFKHSTAEPTPSQQVQNPQSSFSNLREQADRERRLNRKAEPTMQDGRYGFAEGDGQLPSQDDPRGNGRYNRRNARGNRAYGRAGRQTNQNTQETGLYSDQMMVDAPTQNFGRRGGRHR
ncbi:hypothetical protein ALT_4068 [Aspergillus lentulus]|uniref:RRM domain-containing protein n=1 Tax=Aspergillus lentulus TaxID=293939 RepID=A0AAN4PHQ8_ASPLE|nr:uncharacterized protein IFM58399_02241 [Aspergillus lentulus]KAF4160710.1 hypothetical protein CNMCM6069_007495 [Aspergillus lentulus]KAF4180529.1 hypothetical protein CNMCM8060_001222 [Aspergillus lentulus]KAF4185293.1 hypothetical protein CNMCM7927_006856 [Aspergillus lentulus]KAF4195832.1 hypothetical protein CNMCM8694_005846 [Aspergillus lentulus]KAF4210056.1 hypothetical protein CNMCM8927_003321 [Aspergillus lentulus]